MINQIGKSVLLASCLIILTMTSALAAGVIWSSLDWMRSFDSGELLLPFSKLSGSYRLDTTYGGKSGPIEWIQTLVQWYNLSFPGASRFGSGVAIILVPLLLLAWAKPRLSPGVLFFPALLGGAMAGARSMLMLSSTPRFFIFGLISGAVVTVLLTCRVSEPVPSLPEEPETTS